MGSGVWRDRASSTGSLVFSRFLGLTLSLDNGRMHRPVDTNQLGLTGFKSVLAIFDALKGF